MAIRTASISRFLCHEASKAAGQSLAGLPNGSSVAVFDSILDAVIAAGDLLEKKPHAPVWVATGERAAEEIRAARAGRSLFSRLIGGLGDEELFVERILGLAAEGMTVVVTRGRDAAAGPPAFAKARYLLDLNTWTLQETA